MKHTLLLACTLMAGSAFAQQVDLEGIGFPTNTNNTSFKSNNSIKVQNTCDTSFFYDDFEGNNVNQWITINTTPTTTTNNPAQGTYCMEHTGSSSHMQGFYADIGQVQPSELAFYVKTNTLNQHNAYVVIGDDNVQSNYGAIWFYVTSSGFVRFYANGNNDIQTAAVANKWYKIELKNIDFTAKTSDVYLDGVLMQANFPFRHTATNVFSRVHLYNLGPSVANYDSIRIGANFGPVTTLSVTNPLCNGDTTGAIDLTPSGGTSPYTFNWSTTDTTEDLSNLLAGNYIVTLTDDSGCVAIDSAMITEPTAIAVSTDSMGTILCNGDTTGALYTTASGGTPGYTYLWNTGDTMDFITGITGGSYMLTVTDSNNCQHVETIVQTEPDTIGTNATVMPETVNGNDGGIDQTTTGGTSPYTYNWSTGDTLEDLSNLAAGTYTVTITDANGCTEVVTYNVPNNTGISQYNHSSGISIFPNPAKEQVTIRLNQPTAIELFNAIGERLVYEQAQNKQLQLNVSQLPAGVYLLKAGTTTRKLVIE